MAEKRAVLITTRIGDEIEIVHMQRADNTPAHMQITLPTNEQVWCSWVGAEDEAKSFQASLVTMYTPLLPPYREFTPSTPQLHQVGSIDITQFGPDMIRATVSPDVAFVQYACCRSCGETIGAMDDVFGYEYCPLCGDEKGDNGWDVHTVAYDEGYPDDEFADADPEDDFTRGAHDL